MAFKSQSGVGLRHALAIIYDLYRGASRIDDKHVDHGSTGINGILHQLLDDGSRPLNHLTSSYLVGNGIRQEMYQITHFFGLQMKMSSLDNGRI